MLVEAAIRHRQQPSSPRQRPQETNPSPDLSPSKVDFKNQHSPVSRRMPSNEPSRRCTRRPPGCSSRAIPHLGLAPTDKIEPDNSAAAVLGAVLTSCGPLLRRRGREGGRRGWWWLGLRFPPKLLGAGATWGSGRLNSINSCACRPHARRR
jgi:hypothetical protein